MQVLDTYQQIDKIKTLRWIRQPAIFLKPSLRSKDPREVEEARQAHKDLVDRFYSETSHYVPKSQHKAARRDVGYFLKLIDLALAFY